MESMKLTILGSGTSIGVPEVGCTCKVCTSSDPHDRRLRSSALLETGSTTILLDCGPDFRTQMINCGFFGPLDAVLLTHEHYDHVGGLDDLRPYCAFDPVPIYGDQRTLESIRTRMPYCFQANPYPGVPALKLYKAAPMVPFQVGALEVLPLQVYHGKLPILGYRIGPLAYLTDMLTMPEENYNLLKGVKVLVINALRYKPHPTHQNISEALRVSERIGAERTYFTHFCHHVGLNADLERALPPSVRPCTDGLVINL